MGKHMAEVERQIDGILPFLAEQRSRYGTRIEMSIETGTTVGSQKAFVRSVDLGPQLMAKLAAFGIRVSFTAYPCSED